MKRKHGARLSLLLVVVSLCSVLMPRAAEAFPLCSSLGLTHCNHYAEDYCPDGVVSFTSGALCQDEFYWLYDYYIAKCNGGDPFVACSYYYF